VPTILGPGYANLDASIAKNFPLTEVARLKFQGEFYNFTNSTNFLVDNPGSSPNSPRMQNRTPSQNMPTSFGAILADRAAAVCCNSH
jgi:hypothetical protein